MVDSSVDVSDMAVRLFCEPCPNRECAEDQGEALIWSHSKLIECMKKPFNVAEIHLRRTTPRGVNDCDSFTTEGKGDIPDGYPMSCANCSLVGDKENCPYEPIMHVDTYTVGDKLDEWTILNILARRKTG